MGPGARQNHRTTRWRNRHMEDYFNSDIPDAHRNRIKHGGRQDSAGTGVGVNRETQAEKTNTSQRSAPHPKPRELHTHTKNKNEPAPACEQQRFEGNGLSSCPRHTGASTYRDPALGGLERSTSRTKLLTATAKANTEQFLCLFSSPLVCTSALSRVCSGGTKPANMYTQPFSRGHCYLLRNCQKCRATSNLSRCS